MLEDYQLSVKHIAEITKGRLIGDSSLIIKNFNRIEYAQEGELTFYSNNKYEKFFLSSTASCILTDDKFNFEAKNNQCLIFVPNSYSAFIDVLRFVNSRKITPHSFIHPTAIVKKSAVIDDTAYIGPYCIVGENCLIGKHTVLQSSICIGDNVSIGADTFFHSGVIIYDNSDIGSNCIIHSGAVIGSDGFGYIETNSGAYTKIPQLGNVIVGNYVEIGANTTIDRAVAGSTIIGNGVKLDNLVHIAHNVIIGHDTAIAAQTGIAGSTKIGLRNRLGGQVGLIGHIFTGDDVVIAAQSGVSHSLPQKGMYFGSPARDKMKAFRIEAVLRNLPEIYNELKELKKFLAKKSKDDA